MQPMQIVTLLPAVAGAAAPGRPAAVGGWGDPFCLPEEGKAQKAYMCHHIHPQFSVMVEGETETRSPSLPPPLFPSSRFRVT